MVCPAVPALLQPALGAASLPECWPFPSVATRQTAEPRRPLETTPPASQGWISSDLGAHRRTRPKCLARRRLLARSLSSHDPQRFLSARSARPQSAPRSERLSSAPSRMAVPGQTWLPCAVWAEQLAATPPPGYQWEQIGDVGVPSPVSVHSELQAQVAVDPLVPMPGPVREIGRAHV